MYGVIRPRIVVGRITSDQSIAVGTDLIFNSVVANTHPTTPHPLLQYDTATGIWTLGAGRVFRLCGSPAFGNFGSITGAKVTFMWVDTSNNPLANSLGVSPASDHSFPTGLAPSPRAELIYPNMLGPLSVKLRVTAIGGAPAGMLTTAASGSFASVELLD